MKNHEKPWKTIKTNLEPWKTTWNHEKDTKTHLEPWKTNLETWKTKITNLEPWKTIKTHQKPWKTSLELNQIGWTTLFKDFCNNTSVFLQLHFAFLQHVSSPRRLNGTLLIQNTLHEKHGAPTDLLWSKNVTLLTRGQTDLLDVSILYYFFLVSPATKHNIPRLSTNWNSR